MFFEIYQIVILLGLFGYGLRYVYQQGYYQACYEVANKIIIVTAEDEDE